MSSLRACRESELTGVDQATRSVYDAQAELLHREFLDMEAASQILQLSERFWSEALPGEILVSVYTETLLARPDEIRFIRGIIRVPGLFEEWNQGHGVVIPQELTDVLPPLLLCASELGVDVIAYEPSSKVVLRMSHHQVLEIWRMKMESSA